MRSAPLRPLFESIMPFQFTCPYCFKKTLVEDSYAGQSGPCVNCGKTIVLPSGSQQSPSAPTPSPALPASLPFYRRKIFADGIKVGALALGLLVLSGVMFYVLWPSMVGLKARRDKTACMGNLIQIANALNAYAATHGTYPPSVVYDQAGKPMHSWRVLILKELGEAALHNQYNFDEPWDSPNNITLLGYRCPPVFISPAIAGGTRGVSETNYFLITGPGTIFPTTGPLGPQQIVDPLGSTLLVVESNTRTVEWTKPLDIDIAKLNPRIGASGPDTIGGTHAGGATAVFADGTPAWLPNDLSSNLLDAMISPAGGEQVNTQAFSPR